MTKLLEVANLTVGYGGAIAIDDISLSVARGGVKESAPSLVTVAVPALACTEPLSM